MPEPYACRYLALAQDLAALGVIDWPADEPPCDEPAVFSVIVRVRRDGMQYELCAQACATHDRGAPDLHGYDRSVPLRPRTS